MGGGGEETDRGCGGRGKKQTAPWEETEGGRSSLLQEKRSI